MHPPGAVPGDAEMEGIHGFMVFSSIPFLFFFLPAVLLAYFLVPDRCKNGVLFLFSLLFYAWGEPVYIVLMLFSTAVDFMHGKWVDRLRGTPKRARWVVFSSVCINLGLLGFFKYADFFAQTLGRLLGFAVTPYQLPLPIGISFYTFQTMSYTIDVYRGQAPVQRDIIAFGAYVSMFPQLIAGPIVRYQDVAQQMQHRTHDVWQFAQGIQRFLSGLCKKVLLANNIGLVWENISLSGQLSVLSAWLGIMAFAFQIYFDFSGYSDMAIGLGRMFGFSFPMNFNYPYTSKNVSEFWRRWHMTLGAWFRAYVYIPLGGNRKGLPRTVCNLLVVWTLTGLWHGASWNFLLWGLYYGVLLVLERLFLGKWLQRLPAVLQHAYTMVCVLVGWVLFSFESLPAIRHYLRALCFGAPLWDNLGVYSLYTNALLWIVLCVCATPLMHKGLHALATRRGGQIAVLALYAVLFVCCVAYLVDATYNPFLYFRF